MEWNEVGQCGGEDDVEAAEVELVKSGILSGKIIPLR
jgi:hypothetical protein